MKKFFMVISMVVMAMVSNAQIITDMDMESGEPILYLSSGQKVMRSTLPRANYHVGATIEQCISETAYRKYAEEARHYQMPAGGYGAGIMYGGYPVVYGGSGTSFSIGNEHWGFSSSSSNYGGYKASSTGVRIGSFHVGTSSAGYSQPTTSTPSYTRSASSASYEAQKKADAKAAASRYSNMRNVNGSGNGSVNKTTRTASNLKTASNGGNLWNY